MVLVLQFQEVLSSSLVNGVCVSPPVIVLLGLLGCMCLFILAYFPFDVRDRVGLDMHCWAHFLTDDSFKIIGDLT